jgi:hypothetical protein
MVHATELRNAEQPDEVDVARCRAAPTHGWSGMRP